MEERNINPMIFFTIFAILAIATLTFMKETHNQPLTNEIEEIQKKKDGFKEKKEEEITTPK